MKRREFLRSTAALANAAILDGLAPAAQFTPAPCPVTLLPMADYGRDVEREIAAIMSGDGLSLKGKKVLLKPNFIEAHPGRPVNTNPAVIACVAHACLRLGAAQVIVGEASGHRRDPWFSVLNPSLRSVLDKKVRCVDLNHGDAVAVTNRGGPDWPSTVLSGQGGGRSRRLDRHAQDENPSLGGGHSVPEKPLRRSARNLLRLA